MKRMGWADISWEASASKGALGRRKVKKVEVTLCELNPEDERFSFVPPIRVWLLFTSKSIFPIRVKTQSRKGYFGFINNTNTSLKFNKKLCLRILTCHLFCRHPIMSRILCPSHESFIWTHRGLWEKYDLPQEQGWQELTWWVENWLYPWNIFCNIKPTQAHWWVLSFNLCHEVTEATIMEWYELRKVRDKIGVPGFVLISASSHTAQAFGMTGHERHWPRCPAPSRRAK